MVFQVHDHNFMHLKLGMDGLSSGVILNASKLSQCILLKLVLTMTVRATVVAVRAVYLHLEREGIQLQNWNEQGILGTCVPTRIRSVYL